MEIQVTAGSDFQPYLNGYFTYQRSVFPDTKVLNRMVTDYPTLPVGYFIFCLTLVSFYGIINP